MFKFEQEGVYFYVRKNNIKKYFIGSCVEDFFSAREGETKYNIFFKKSFLYLIKLTNKKIQCKN